MLLQRERAIGCACDGARARWNRIAMRAGNGMVEQLVDPVLELFADMVRAR
jgi:hypothetical protein